MLGINSCKDELLAIAFKNCSPLKVTTLFLFDVFIKRNIVKATLLINECMLCLCVFFNHSGGCLIYPLFAHAIKSLLEAYLGISQRHQRNGYNLYMMLNGLRCSSIIQIIN